MDGWMNNKLSNNIDFKIHNIDIKVHCLVLIKALILK